MDFIPHTDAEISEMLEFVGVESLDNLFDMVPSALRLAGGLDVANGISEFDTMNDFETMVAKNRSDLICFAGGGAYDHEVPSVVRRLSGRTEFVTAYTPYQPEVAQGVLQALFEYQTLISRISGLPIANASLYDGATACVEAANLAVGVTGKQRFIRSAGLNPLWAQTMDTMAIGTGYQYIDAAIKDGVTDWAGVENETDIAGVVVQYPNYFGALENIAEARRVADAHGAKLIVAFDPVLAGLLKTPGSLGADVVVGEGQPFGTPMSFGGPYLGLFACRTEHVRKLPGRLVGETVDADAKKAYVTTLRTREQDIRREKATSNVCTNQTLIAVTAAIQLAWLGTEGLREVGLRCARATKYLKDSLLEIDGVSALSTAPTVREFAITTPLSPDVVVDRMIDEGFLAGVPIDQSFGNALLVAATERRTKAEIDAYVTSFEKVIS